MSAFGNLSKFCIACLSAVFFISCSKVSDVSHNSVAQCAEYKDYASVSFDVNGDMADIIEKSAKKAFAKSCYKKSDNSSTNLRVRIDSKALMKKQTGVIKDDIENTLSISIAVVMLMPTDDGGLTTLTSKQEASLKLKSQPIADIGNKSEIKDEDVTPFVENNVLVALENLIKSSKEVK